MPDQVQDTSPAETEPVSPPVAEDLAPAPASPAPLAPPPAPAPASAKENAAPASPKGSEVAGKIIKERPTGEALLEQLKDLPVGEIDALLAALDAETDVLRGQAGEIDADDGEEDDDEDLTVGAASTSPGPVNYSQLDEGTRQAIAAVHNFRLEQALQQAIDSDEELSYNMKHAPAAAQDSVRSFIKDRVERIVDGMGDQFNYDWNRVAKAAVGKEKARVQPFFEHVSAGMGSGPGRGFAPREIKVPARPQGASLGDPDDYREFVNQKMEAYAALLEREQGTQGA